jgi:hypothetical protein
LRKGKQKKEDEDDLENDDLSSFSESSKGKTSTLSCYMEDEYGQAIPESQRKAARHTAKLFWNGLLKRKTESGAPLKLPSSGQKVDLDIREEFVFLMEDTYPWLRYCENHWKTDKLWSNHYPNWYKTVTGEVIDVDMDDDGAQEPPKRTLKRRVVHSDANDPQKRPRVEEDTSKPPVSRRPLVLRTKVCSFHSIPLYTSLKVSSPTYCAKLPVICTSRSAN